MPHRLRDAGDALPHRGGGGAGYSLARGIVTLSDGQAAALIVCGMILSELVSATFLTTLYRFRRRKLKGRDTVPLVKILGDISSVAVPVSLATLLGRLISSANMVLIPRVLMRAGRGQAAMEEFGVLSGMTMPMLMLPRLFSPLITVLSPRWREGAGRCGDDPPQGCQALHVRDFSASQPATAMLVVGEGAGVSAVPEPAGRQPPADADGGDAGRILLRGGRERAGEHRPAEALLGADRAGQPLRAGVHPDSGRGAAAGLTGYLCGELLSALLGAGCACFGSAPHRPLPGVKNWGGPSAAGLGDGGGLCAAALCKAGEIAVLPALRLGFVLAALL